MANNRFSNKLNQYFTGNIRLSFVDRYVILVVTKDDKVYEFKKSMFRNTVLITCDNKAVVDSLVEKSLVGQLCGKRVTDFRSGKDHTIARTSDYNVYCWGWSSKGLLGNGINDGRGHKPARNEYLSDKNVTDVCCGLGHSLALTIDGQVYAWGGNEEGQIGNGKPGGYQPTPYHVNGFDGEKVKAIACGERHSMALTEMGKVFSWGFNQYGQLGIGIEDENWNSPKRIEMNGVTIEKICCGQCHSLLLSRDGHIYGFGNGESGQLGTSVDSWRQLTPKKLIYSNKFTNIASHWRHDISAARSESGSWYIWGYWKEKISEPKGTDFRSFDDVLAHYWQVNYKPIEGRISLFDDTFIRNRKYRRVFKELEKLGKGCFGEVFKVCKKHGSSRSDFCAVKKVSFSADKEREFLKELETCIIIQELSDERLVKYLDVWVEDLTTDDSGLKDCNFYIQMELCDTNLGEVIKEIKGDSNLIVNDCLTPLSYFIASEIFIEILKGVQYLHQHNPPVIHRDLKPDNILLKIESNRRAYVKIGDFGLVAFHEFAQQSHTQYRGALKYQAPEVQNGREYGTKADIYSLGVIARGLFHIDFDREYLNDEKESQILMLKYQAMSDLSAKMNAVRVRDRPKDCDEILEAKSSWALNANEFDVRKSLENFEFLVEQNSYVLKFTKHLL